MKVILIGYRATGKSTVGLLLAGKLKIPFWDTDTLVEENQGMSIKEIISLKGWDYFRLREKEAIQKLSRLGDGVVATGGGVVLLPENVALLKQMGPVVWLHAPLHDIIERIKNDARSETGRPQFTQENIVQETIAVLKQRIPLYEKTADFNIDTTVKSAEQAAAEIIYRVTEKNKLS
jgi:shikimate kinase